MFRMVHQNFNVLDLDRSLTFYKEALWRSKGCVGVDMECSVLFGVGGLKGMETVMIMFVSDKHPSSPDEKKEWTWHTPKDLRERFSERCLAFALEA